MGEDQELGPDGVADEAESESLPLSVPEAFSVGPDDGDVLDVADGPQEPYKVSLPNFEGPLDLLLHLIRKHELNIFDIPILVITQKYIAYIEWMRGLNLDIAGEFLVMAATLAQIKSRMLLPQEPGEDEEPEEQEDPREELVKRLLEYQRYKEAAQDLRDRPILDRDVFSRVGGAQTLSEDEAPFAEVSVFKLIESFERVLRNAKTPLSHNVVVDRVSIAARIQELVDLLALKAEVTFEELFEGITTKIDLITTFISLLEMSRLKMIHLRQMEDSEVIYIKNRLQGVDVESVLASANLEK